MDIHQLLQRQLKNMKDMRIIVSMVLIINMNSENSDDEKFEPQDYNEILRVKKEVEKLIAERTLWNKKDFDSIHKIEDL